VLAVNPVNHPGGAETVLLRLLRGLAARGWRITNTTPGGGVLADQSIAAGLAWEPLRVGGLERGRGAAAVLSSPALRRLSRDADVVYLNGSVCGRMLPTLAGRHVVAVLDVNDMVERAPRFWRRADVILADSHAVADRLTSLDPRLAPRVVGLPVDLDPPAEPDPWPDAQGPVIGFVGRLEPRKGVHDLLDAVPAIRAGLPTPPTVVLVGEEPYGLAPEYTRRVLGDAAALGVEHHGWVPNAPGLMRHMDVLVLPSHAEPFGTVLAEAMAVGTPVVATAVDGLVEVVEDGVTGRLVPPGNPERLAAAVLEVLASREAMSAAARRRGARWGAEAYIEATERLLAERIAAV
jgi:glycosyltransferase involved in cell wall biosynthesis